MEEEQLQQRGGGGAGRRIWPFKTLESVEKGMALFDDRKATQSQKDQVIERLLLTESPLVAQAMPQLLQAFYRGTITIRHAWLAHFEEFCRNGVAIREYLPEFSRYLRDPNYHFRESVGSFLAKRGTEIVDCYKDINWCLTQRDEEVRKLGLRLAEVLGVDMHDTTRTILSKLSKSTDVEPELIQKASELLNETSAQPGLTQQESGTSRVADASLPSNISCTSLLGKKVLLLAQSRPTQMILSKLMSHFGAEAELIDDPAMGIKYLRRVRSEGKPCELVILDLADPEEMLRHLKNERRREEMGVLVLSKPLESDQVRRLVSFGVEGLLLKPFGVSDLTETIGSIMDTVGKRT